MRIGTVLGIAPTEKRADCLQEASLLLVQTEEGILGAADLAGARTGDRVLLTVGPAAGRLSIWSAADAAVVAVLQEPEGKSPEENTKKD